MGPFALPHPVGSFNKLDLQRSGTSKSSSLLTLCALEEANNVLRGKNASTKYKGRQATMNAQVRVDRMGGVFR